MARPTPSYKNVLRNFLVFLSVGVIVRVRCVKLPLEVGRVDSLARINITARFFFFKMLLKAVINLKLRTCHRSELSPNGVKLNRHHDVKDSGDSCD